MPEKTILAIDTSCDDTAVAILYGNRVLSSIISSQIDLHAEFGGVVPHIARRAHEKNLPHITKTALKRARKNWEEIDTIAVTHGPGLAPALEVGIKFAKNLAQKYKKPLLAVNHMEGHLLSPFLKNKNGNFYEKKAENIKIENGIGLLVSGGHTEIVHIQKLGKYEILGETRDDAAGEAFDKVARMLGLGYPGGPIIAELARDGNPTAFDLPRPMQHSKNLDFSFSGLKTAAMYTIRELGGFEKMQKQQICNFCASFEHAVAEVLTKKVKKAIETKNARFLVIGGGVSSNLHLRKTLRKQINIPLLVPGDRFCTDNAAMIGLAAQRMLADGKIVENIEKLDRIPNLNF